MNKKLMAKINVAAMALVGIVLIVSAMLKVVQLLNEPIISEGFYESWLFWVIATPLELGLGIWLVCGIFRKAGWLLAIFAFLFFAGQTLYRAFIGSASCGCFGQIEVNPWVSLLAIDVPLLAVLLIFRPVNSKLLEWPAPAHFFGTAVPTFLLLGMVVYTTTTYKPEYELLDPNEWMQKTEVRNDKLETKEQISDVRLQTSDLRLQDRGQIEPNVTRTQKNDSGRIPATREPNVPVEPKMEEQQTQAITPPQPEVPVDIQAQPQQDAPLQTESQQPDDIEFSDNGQQWPLLKYIDVADQLGSGIAVVMLYHYNCPTCAEAIPQYEQYSKQLSSNENPITFAFIAGPPYAPKPEDDPVPQDTAVLTGRLETPKKLIFESPIVVILIDGAVVEYWQGRAPDFDELLNALFK